MSESPCQVESLQRQIFALDEQIADAETHLRFAQVGEHFAVAVRPIMSASAHAAFSRVHAGALRCQSLLGRLRSRRRRLAKEFERRKRLDCGACSRCIVNL